MNVKSIGAFALGMLMLASCTSEDLKLTGGLNESSEYIPGNSTYEIRLRGRETATLTRAAILGDSSVAVLDSMGIFALAREKQGTNQAAYDIQWFHDTRNWSFCIMNNVAAKMEHGNITWKEDTVFFYPISQFYHYDFYGYYPYTDDITRYDNSIVAHYTIDGTNDIIWGRATSDEDFAYSAKYYRTYGNLAKHPVVQLKHLLTRLTFSIEPGESAIGNGDYTDAEKMKVKSIQLCDVYTHLDVRVADRENIDEADWSNPDWYVSDYDARISTRDGLLDTLILREENHDVMSTVQVPLHDWVVNTNAGKGLHVGESVMLFPDEEYMVRVVVLDEENREHVSEIPLTLQSALAPTNPEKFRRGYSYNIRVIVHGPRAIALQGQLEPWNEVDGPELEL